MTYRLRFGGHPSSSWNRRRYSTKVILCERNYLSSWMTRLHCANYNNRFDRCVSLIFFFFFFPISRWARELDGGQSTPHNAWVKRVGVRIGVQHALIWHMLFLPFSIKSKTLIKALKYNWTLSEILFLILLFFHCDKSAFDLFLKARCSFMTNGPCNGYLSYSLILERNFIHEIQIRTERRYFVAGFTFCFFTSFFMLSFIFPLYFHFIENTYKFLFPSEVYSVLQE